MEYKRMYLAILVSLMVVWIGVESEVNPTLCEVQIQTRHLPSTFNMNNRTLESKAFLVTISEESEHNCLVNLTELIPQMSLPSFPAEEVVGFICKSRNRIYFSEYEGEQAKHILFHIEVKDCVLDMANLNSLLNIADTRVLAITGIVEIGDEPTELAEEDALRNVVSFAFKNVDTEIQNFTNIFRANTSYPSLAEIVLENVTFDSIPFHISEKFPNLQSLELPRNELSIPPQIFPWTMNWTLLPRNLSRTPFMQSHYSASEYIEIPSNVFRRFLNLDGNGIHNLSDYVFNGQIDKISLKGNGLHTISNITFRNISQLQNLDLSNNMLRELPGDLFQGLKSLRKLDLSGNQIQTLSNDIFDDLISLRFLNLANNSLDSLPKGLLASLQSLEVIRLERNKLTYIDQNAFPLNSVKLTELHFQYNPITELPNFPFYLRSLKLANFQATHIAFRNFTDFLEGFFVYQVYVTVVDTASDIDKSDLLERAEVLRKIDLSDCNITSLHLTEKLTPEMAKLLKVLLLHFEFVLQNNPMMCNCDIISLASFIKRNSENGTFPKNEYFFNDWLCQSPTELEGRKMLSLKPAETYCEVTIPKCPQECTCYERATIKHIIVDCRNKNLSQIHRMLPAGNLELWYGGNNIINIDSFPNPEMVLVLDVSGNKLETISGEVMKRMKSLKVLRINSNVLAYIPYEISELNLETVTIFPNPLTCNCQTLWMKDWLEKNKHVVKNWYKVACKIENEDGKVLIEVPNDKFVCNEDFDELRRVILPSAICSALTLLLVIAFVLLYAYRLECKVLIFVYFGIHPFDRDSHEHAETLDCVIVHSGLQTDWVMDNIVPLLENETYEFVVCDMARDFVIGYSFQENLTRTVRNSKRMIFCLSEDWKTSSDSFTTAWRIAREKIKDTRSHYGIIVSHEIKKNDIQDNELNRFIKRGRFVDSKDKLFGNKIIYYMPQVLKNKSDMHNTNARHADLHISKCFINSRVLDRSEHRSHTFENRQQSTNVEFNALTHAFISYHDDDIEYVLKELLPLLEEKGFNYCIADRDFVPGASIEENVLNAIDRSHRTIFILSPKHIENEWSLFTFRAAYEKALREKSNHLIVIVKEKVEDKDLDEEIKYYLKNFICLNVNDRWFEKKLFNGLPLLDNQKDLHTSPLFLRCECVDENEVTVEVESTSKL